MDQPAYIGGDPHLMGKRKWIDFYKIHTVFTRNTSAVYSTEESKQEILIMGIFCEGIWYVIKCVGLQNWAIMRVIESMIQHSKK